MAYASLTDVNVHLPIDKAHAQDAQIVDLNLDAQRLIRARLVNNYDQIVLDLWTSPTATPELIREIAGKLIAAKFYAKLIAEDDPTGSAFAQELYNEAIASLNDLRDGNITLLDTSGNIIANSDFSPTSFWPNNSTQAPSFAVAEVWA
jgi:hypothetical protein